MLSLITLTSPSGKTFSGKWIGNSFTTSKKVGVFEYPGVNGSRTQDLGIASSNVEIELYFDGDDHGKRAVDLENALSEKGAWKIQHPTRGLLTMQPISITVEDQPVKSISSTKITTSWIKYIPGYEGGSLFSALPSIARKAMETQKSIRSVLPDDTTGKTQSWISSFRARMSSILAKIKSIYNKVNAITGTIKAKLTNLYNTINFLLSAPIIALQKVIETLHAIINFPAMIAMNVKEKVVLFKRMTDSFASDLEELAKANTIKLADAQASEMAMSGVASAVCLAVTNGEPAKSREESFYIAREIITINQSTVDTVDTLQTVVTDGTFTSFLTGFENLFELVGLTVNFIGSESYSPTVKKTVTIDSPTPTLLFALKSYPDLPIDQCYDYLCDSNNLTGERIIMLNAGTTIDLFLKVA